MRIAERFFGRTSNSPRPASKRAGFIDRPIRNALLVVVGAAAVYDSYSIVEPGMRGVRSTMGAVSENPVTPGVSPKWPFFQRIHQLSVKSRTDETTASCFSKDLQQMDVEISILWQIPDDHAVKIYRDYQGDPFSKLVEPRAQEAIKEVTITYSAEDLVHFREKAKAKILEILKGKVGEVTVVDINVENINLSDRLEAAIDEKMVQQQQAEQATFDQKLRTTHATIDVIRSLGEAGGIAIQGEALKLAPEVLELRIAQKWNGRLPEVISRKPGDKTGETAILLPMGGATRREGEVRTVEQIFAQLDSVKENYFTLINAEKAKFPEDR